jgi:hypothetical protein
MYPKHYVLKKLCVQITINLAFYLLLFFPFFSLRFHLCFFPLFGSYGFTFAFLPFSNLLTVPLLYFAINPCVYFMCRNGWPLHSHKWIYGIMHNWRSKGCRKYVNHVKGKNTIQLRSSTPNRGFFAFEHHGNNLQSWFFHFSCSHDRNQIT